MFGSKRGAFLVVFSTALRESASSSSCGGGKGWARKERAEKERKGRRSELKKQERARKKKKKKKLIRPLDPLLFPLETKTNSLPDTAAACSSEWKIVKQTWARRQDLPLSEAGLYAAFAGEVFAWFCVGEVVGRGGSISGYSV